MGEHKWRAPRVGEAQEEGGICENCGLYASEARGPCEPIAVRLAERELKNVDTSRRATHAEPNRQDPFIEPPWAELDMRIRETVRLLWRAGYHPRDSGDGRSKPDMECALGTPNVFMVCMDPRDLVREAERLHQLMSKLGVDVQPQGEDVGPGKVSIQASYDPANGLGVIALFGVDDEMIGLVPGGEQDSRAEVRRG
jgi:hypothetical protein